MRTRGACAGGGLAGAVLSASLALAFIPSARAAAPQPSFDCAKASTVVEKTICKDPKLAEKDAKLADAYKASLARLPEPDRADFHNGQREWIRFTRLVCGVKSDFQSPETCLSQAYDTRQKQVETSYVALGGLKFRRIDRFDARLSPANQDYPNAKDFPTITREVSYPQIDQPASPGEIGFNAEVSRRVQKFGGFEADADDQTDYSFGFSLLNASPRLISVELDQYMYEHGAAHGQPSSSMLNWLPKENRALKTSDVFDSSKTWADFLKAYCFKILSKQEGSFVDSIQKLDGLPDNPERWRFTPEGLAIHFNPYEVAAYAFGEPEVVVPWKVLKPYLVADPAIR